MGSANGSSQRKYVCVLLDALCHQFRQFQWKFVKEVRLRRFCDVCRQCKLQNWSLRGGWPALRLGNLPPSQPDSEASFAEGYASPFHRRVKNAVDLHDVIVEQALDLD